VLLFVAVLCQHHSYEIPHEQGHTLADTLLAPPSRYVLNAVSPIRSRLTFTHSFSAHVWWLLVLPGQLPPGIRAVIVVKEGKNNDRRSDVPEVADKQTDGKAHRYKKNHQCSRELEEHQIERLRVVQEVQVPSNFKPAQEVQNLQTTPENQSFNMS
jgi:hypothetical protein